MTHFDLQRRAALGLILSAVLFSFLCWQVVSSGTLHAFDHRLYDVVLGVRQESLLILAYAVTFFANTLTVILIGLFSAAVFTWKWHQKNLFFGIATTLLIGQLLSSGFKLLFARARPENVLPILTESTYSFPSGHAMAAAALYGFLAYAVITHTKHPKTAKILVATVVGILLIDMSRLVLGVHFLTDVIAGNMIGCIAFCIGIFVSERTARRT